ncbi:cystin-1-like [Rhinatrema bivittatum]|uniref:cystin-1-like n=1 Tax=Rhinatrema bivittatum TaxID=194408 RepID=UPI0011294A33|nr:cystin-1-like [Rhinatrema bivittatum]
MGSSSSKSRRRRQERSEGGGEAGSDSEGARPDAAVVEELPPPDVPEPAPRERSLGPAGPPPGQDSDEPALFTRSAQDIESNRFPCNFQTSDKMPKVQDPIVYDRSEQELMASIEQEYCC